MTARLPLIVCLLVLLTGSRGQEGFDLSQGLDDPTVAPTPKKEINPTVKPAVPKPATTAPKSVPKADDDLDLGDALGGDDLKPTEKTQPGGGGGGGGGGSFGDADLVDHHDHDDNPPKDPSGTDGKHRGRAMQPSSGGEEDIPAPEPQSQSVLAGILSAVGVAAVGAISSFIAYQKKKLCFKGQQEDPENVNMDNQKGDQNDPQAQTNLLAK